MTSPDKGRITGANVAVMAGLLVLPILALQRRGLGFWWVYAYGLVLGALTYWAYAVDKRRAREKRWRLAESRLHLLSLLGGWPGAFLAQRRLRHKCSKHSFQFVFWLMVLGYQFVAWDSLQAWRYTQALLNQVGNL
jgi:uncharacterized membrane protein YsdA (DUF1294 family)